jgi:tryptophan-rich sensory protein
MPFSTLASPFFQTVVGVSEILALVLGAAFGFRERWESWAQQKPKFTPTYRVMEMCWRVASVACAYSAAVSHEQVRKSLQPRALSMHAVARRLTVRPFPGEGPRLRVVLRAVRSGRPVALYLLHQ